MTIQAIGGVIAIPNYPTGISPSTNSLLIDAAGEKVEIVFQVPLTGTISKVGFRTSGIGVSQTLRIGLQTITTGDASGTAYGGMAAGTQAAPAENTFYTVTLGTGATATKDDIIAAVIEFDSTVGAVNIAAIGNGGGTDIQTFPYVGLYTTAWARQTYIPILSIEYSDGSYYYIGAYPAVSWSDIVFNNASTPDEYALRFNLPVPVRIVGAWGFIDYDNATDLVLYEGTTAQRTASLDPNNRGATASQFSSARFATAFTTAASTTYYLSVKPTTASNIGVRRLVTPNAGSMGQLELGINAYEATRTDAGAWSNNTSARPWVGLLIDGIDDGAGGGGAVNPINGLIVAR